MNIVEIKDVCKKYPEFQLNNVFFFEKGMINGFIGRKGAGKTITIKSMLNLIHTDSGVFFITLCIFESFQSARKSNDIVFSALLPVAKRDVVKGKYLFYMLIELSGFCAMSIITIFQMTVLSESQVYRVNALMNANPFYRV